MKIKVCGLRYQENIKAVAALKPDYMGFIFYGKSARFVDDLPVDALTDIPASVNKVAVFVNETSENVRNIINKFDFDFIQLHGNETPAFCKALRDEAIVIKAFGIDKNFDFEQLNRFKNKADMFLFDTKTDGHGGSGQTFDWDILDKYEMDIPFFISGGLSAANIEAAMSIKHPAFYGVDLNSKFEVSPGLKDIDKLKTAFSLKQSINELRS